MPPLPIFLRDENPFRPIPEARRRSEKRENCPSNQQWNPKSRSAPISGGQEGYLRVGPHILENVRHSLQFADFRHFFRVKFTEDTQLRECAAYWPLLR